MELGSRSASDLCYPSHLVPRTRTRLQQAPLVQALALNVGDNLERNMREGVKV